MAHAICTFNVNNLYARYRFGATYPGDKAKKSAAEAGWGYLPINEDGMIELFNQEQRALAARALARGKANPKPGDFPDVACLQEVESLAALRKFNKEHLGGAYDYALLIDGRDLRQIDVAILSRLDILGVRSHMDDPDPKPGPGAPYLFSRDCLEVDLGLNKSGSQRLTLLVNHFKSKYAESAEERKRGDARRTRQAAGGREVVRRRFPGAAFKKEWFAVVGDLNDEPASPPVAPLAGAGSGLVDAMTRIATVAERWTHWYRSANTVSQLDYLLLSPALAAATSAVPEVERGAIGFARYLQDGSVGPKKSYFHRQDSDPSPVEVDFHFPRLGKVTPDDYASDHCPVFLEVP